jgi:phospholipase C
MEVEINVINAENIRKMDLFGSEPLIQIILQKENLTIHKTKSHHSLNPKYMEKFKYTIKEPINNSIDLVCINNKAIGPKSIIGKATFPLNKLRDINKGEEVKFELQLLQSGFNGSCGTLSMLFKPLNVSYKTLESRFAKKKIEHYVVLMQENRSFDSIFGYLYKPEEIPKGKTFEGVIGKNLSNPIPSHMQTEDGPKEVPVSKGYDIKGPKIDPGEEYPHVMTQLFNMHNPEDNRKVPIHEHKSPFNTPKEQDTTPTMDGFVRDYIYKYPYGNRELDKVPTYDEYSQIMKCFPPESLPVLSTLAKEFAVFDHWFCSVPSQTFTNRTFFHCGTSGGKVGTPLNFFKLFSKENEPFSWWIHNFKSKTVFEQLHENGLSWVVYYDTKDILPLTMIIHYQNLKNFAKNFKSMKEFYIDCKEGTLPHYAFIEPRLFFDHNDMHPPYKFKNGYISPSSMLAGEELISDIYMAIRESNSNLGSNFSNTCFTITFDEHGGLYDHVPPPKAIPPDDLGLGQYGFGFNRYGVRVPTIVISAYTRPKTIVNEVLSHCSMMKTIRKNWDIDESLTNRDKSVNSIPDEVFELETPRSNTNSPQTEMDWPFTFPRQYTKCNSEEKQNAPLNDLQKNILMTVASFTGDKIAFDETQPTAVLTAGAALKFLEKSMKKLGLKLS